jgi:hypothetical protein
VKKAIYNIKVRRKYIVSVVLMVLISLSMFSYLLPSITKSLQRKMISGLAKGLFDTRGHVLFEKKPSLFYYTNRKDLVTLLYKEFLFFCVFIPLPR